MEPTPYISTRRAVGAPRRVLVVGGGFVGSHVARGFVHRSIPTTVLTHRVPSDIVQARVSGADLIIGDAADADVLGDALGEAEHVVWCAGGSRPAESNVRPLDDLRTALPPLLSALEVLTVRNVRLTFMSSGGTVYGDPTILPVPEHHTLAPRSAYGVTKAAAELYLGMHREVSGFMATALRCGNVYGVGQESFQSQGVVATALECARRSLPFPMIGDGSAVRDYIHVDDVVDVVCTLAGRADPPQVVNVGTGVGTSTAALIEEVEHVTGRRLQIERQAARVGDVKSIVLDVTLLRSVMGFDPIPVDVGIARLWSELGERGSLVRL